MTEFELSAVDVRYGNNLLLRNVVQNGHLAAAQWLCAEFKLSAQNARALNNYALRMHAKKVI